MVTNNQQSNNVTDHNEYESKPNEIVNVMHPTSANTTLSEWVQANWKIVCITGTIFVILLIVVIILVRKQPSDEPSQGTCIYYYNYS